MSALDAYFEIVQDMQRRVLGSQREILLALAGRMADVTAAGRRIFLFGTGHSHLLPEEAFYRAGGLASATPIFSSGLMLHEDVHLSGRLERLAGLAAPILQRYHPQPGEMLFIFSNSGANQLPVEMALEGKKQGLYVVSVSSLAYARLAPLSALGQRLDQAADLALDNGGVPGDAVLPLEGSEWRAGPTSSILAVLIWNSLVVECLSILQERGWNPEALPVYASFNMKGAGDHNAALLEQWRKVNPHL